MTTPLETTDDSDLRTRILSAARRIFLDGPPESATMDAVAQAAGMSKKTIYREFKSQLELLGALLDESAADIGPINPPSSRENVEAELSALILHLMRHIMAPRSMALIRLIVQEVRRYPELLKMRKDRGFHLKLVASWLDHEFVRDRHDIGNAEDAAAMLFGMVMQDAPFKLMLIPADRLPEEEMKRRADTGVAIFLRGVRC